MTVSAAEITRIRIPVGTGTVATLMALPDGPGPFGAVIYNHGTVVREKGYEKARALGYDPADYVAALAAAGYIGLAPLREHLSAAAPRSSVIEGVQVVSAAVRYLQGRADVLPSRIGAIGFSEGGLVTLWSAIRGVPLSAIVLMSPATMRDAGDWQLKAAARMSSLENIKIPVFLTVGARDIASIRRVIDRRLIPNMRRSGMKFTARTDYPGDHKWFWKVRDSHFADVKAFLDQNLR